MANDLPKSTDSFSRTNSNQDFAQLRERGEELKKDAAQTAKKGWEETKDKAQDLYHKAKEGGEDLAHKAKDHMHAMEGHFCTYTRDNPKTSLGIAFGAGALLALLLSR